MMKPRVLRRGARVAVVSPASAFSREALSRGLDELKGLGLEPVVDPRIFERARYVSGPASLRAAVLSDALADPSIDAVIGTRGGYGSVHVLLLLDPDRVSAARKPIIGYSDLTSLLQFVTLDCGTVSFHGPTVVGRLSEGPGRYDRESFRRSLMCAEPLGELRPAGVEVLREGESGGLLLGGTLTQLCASLGTPFAFAPPPGFVLLIDEVNERPYRLDRMMTQLKLAGILSRAAGIVCNGMPDCDEPGGAVTARDVMDDLLADFEGPVLWGFPTGHTSGPAMTLPLGVRVRVIARPGDPALVVEEAAVEDV
jgi:muramoyltetrapeptide carboxypeptidase